LYDTDDKPQELEVEFKVVFVRLWGKLKAGVSSVGEGEID